jgi:hypothetical protein
LQNVCSFPIKSKAENRIYLNESLVRYTRDDDLEDDEDEEDVIVEDEMETEWSENE